MLTTPASGKSIIKWLCAAALLLTAGLAEHRVGADEQEGQPAVSFNRDIRPILADKCFHCHGPDEESRKADLRFDIRESALAVIEPGDMKGSLLIDRILEEDPELVMPPPHIHKRLTASEIERLKQWIVEGANWSRFWAYEPPRETPVPASKNSSSGHWIDAMIIDRLEKYGQELSPPADRTTLLRRVYFDLIGLPPTPQQVSDFLADKSPRAFENVVDALLASQHFGERMAIYWLDLVRYADTVGYHGDQDHNIAPYRDWIIRAFNDNMPFDQFTREQLAGDLLPDSTESQKIASGYNRLLQTTHEGGLQPKEYSAIYAADRVRNVSMVWMAATVGCAQCHDHKYDPYTSTDFYSLAAFFADVDDEQHFKSGTNSLPTSRSPELLVISAEDREQLDQATNAVRDASAQVQKLKKQLATMSKEASPEDDAIGDLKAALMTATAKLNRLKAVQKRIESRGAWTMVTRALKTPRTIRVLPRGNWMDESGPVVEPAIPQFMGTLDTKTGRATRLDLANWLTDGSETSGRLTARVLANRLWYLFMGVGLSRSLDDFGGQGEAPAFPELLDNLAIELIRNRWDIKKLVRTIVTSRTYAQVSIESEEIRKLDPYNQLFSHQSRFRLPAELVRDNALAISGLLNVDEVGGKSVKPYQPQGYYQHLNFPTRKYVHHADRRQWRRGVYVHWQRQFLHPSLKAFDAPSREECTAQRPKSNTPSAALVLLNDPIFVEASRVFAIRMMQEAERNDFESRLKLGYQFAVSRFPADYEISILRRLFDDNHQVFRDDPEKAMQLISVGQAATPADLDPGELAAWTMVARAILNLNETMARN